MMKEYTYTEAKRQVSKASILIAEMAPETLEPSEAREAMASDRDFHF
jgi:hypothetical protein